jgi:hypothetical protein
MAEDPGAVASTLQNRFEVLTGFHEIASQLDLPIEVSNHPGINLGKFEEWAEDIATMAVPGTHPK